MPLLQSVPPTSFSAAIKARLHFSNFVGPDQAVPLRNRCIEEFFQRSGKAPHFVALQSECKLRPPRRALSKRIFAISSRACLRLTVFARVPEGRPCRYFDAVGGRKRRDAGGGAGEDEVAGFECKCGSDVAEQSGHGKMKSRVEAC